VDGAKGVQVRLLSLRQYTQPDPKDLPNLFFTEGKLDQIEDDFYITMSTDNIEIVSVSSMGMYDGDDAINTKVEEVAS